MTWTRYRHAPLAAAAVLTIGLLASQALAALAQEESPASGDSPGGEPIPTDAIEGVTWLLAEQLIDGALTGVPEDVVVTLLLEDGAIGGSGGCNSYFGSYTLDGDAVTFSGIGSTLMACEPPAGDVETAYFSNLELVATWFSDGGSLTLNDGTGVPVLRFIPQVDAEPIPTDGIEGLAWQLGEQAVDGALAPLPEGVDVTLTMAEGQAGGNGGCNTYFADYTLEASSLSFGTVGSTMMACDSPAGDVEAAYFTNLALVASWASDGASLTLSDADGNTILVFAAASTATIVGGWVASGINSGTDAVVTTELTPIVTAVFDADGTLRGNDGCNNYSTIYALDGEAISISDAIITTRMACPSDELAEQSAQYFAALVAATTWALDPSGNLELRDDSGALQVLFTPAAG
jgi:heat shock protein HslJ